MTRSKFVTIGVLTLFCLWFAFFVPLVAADAIVADHNAVSQFGQIPDSVIQAIENHYLIFYSHTSHGSQIMTGISLIHDEDPFYNPPDFQEYGDDLGYNGDTSWVPPTRNWLDTHPEFNMVMWSWCGGCSDNTEEGINIYLSAVSGLEQDYPAIVFIYMTGHLDGTGPEGNLYARNNQIRDYCVANGKVLFDFADIESYDPDGNYYPDGSDACEWCYDWCDIYTCPSCDCAHSHCFNCYQKGKAWWWMVARIWGWTSDQDSIPHVVSTSPAQNELNLSIDVNISVAFDIPMDETTINESTFVVNAWSTGLHPGTITYDSPTKTATLNPSEDFDEGEIVTVVLTTGMQSAMGVALSGSCVWSFTADVSEESPGTFVTALNYSAGDNPLSVFCADLDGDSDLDLAVANNSDNTVSILKNIGHGTFQAKVDYNVGRWPTSVFCADLDNDSDLDLAVANSGSQEAGSDSISILKNNGDGTFQTKVDYEVGDYPWSVFCADLDGDGNLDLAVANSGTEPNYIGSVSILKNDGDGTFKTKVDYGVGSCPLSVFCADLDGDGDLDLAVVNRYSDSISILRNNGDGTFQIAVNYETGADPWSAFCADLDGNGDLDLAIANWDGDHISILKNNGDGTFQTKVDYGVGDKPSSVFCMDLDGDGDLDLVVANGFSDNISILKNNGDGTFQTKVDYDAGDGAYSVFCADLDGDADLDLAVANVNSDNVSILLNICRGDCNGDEVVDVGDVVFLVSYLYRGGPAPEPVEVGDVNIDGIVNVGDVVYLVSYLYRGGSPPKCF